MKLKIWLIAFFAFLCVSAIAQDKIYKADGSIISSKVTSVGTSTIIYKRFDNPDGPEYTILKKDVDKIVYQNGTVDYFNGIPSVRSHFSGNDHRKTEAGRSGNNILTVIPGAFTAEVIDNSINDPGIGICYERTLDERGHISFFIPVLINFEQNKDFTSEIFNNGYGSTLPASGSYNSYLFMPGIKFYPADNTHKFRYAVGVSLFALFGSEPYWAYDNSNIYGQMPADWHYSMYGLSATNSLNISVSKNFFMEFDINMLMTLSDNRVASTDALDNDVLPIMQLMLKAGYRF